MDTPVAPEPDDKDWTWVLKRPCPDCGYDAATVDRTELPQRIRETVRAIVATLAEPDAAERPSPSVCRR